MKHYLSTFAGSAICGGLCIRHLARTLEDIRSDGRLAGGNADYRHHVVYESL